jgi:hypothetical protein
MTTQHYKQLEDGPMDDIDACVWNGDLFHNRDNIRSFRDMMARWERGLQMCEDILNEVPENDE